MNDIGDRHNTFNVSLIIDHEQPMNLPCQSIDRSINQSIIDLSVCSGMLINQSVKIKSVRTHDAVTTQRR